MEYLKYSTSLINQLKEYSDSDFYPFHMPGHKRARLDFPNPWSVDITEIEGFDNLHHAQGILAELQEQAARLFGAEKSFLLINGSTCGLLGAVSACVRRGGKLLMSRNCHKSVYHAVYLRALTPVYVMPEMTDFGIMGSLSPEAVEDAFLREPDIEAVLIVSPNYDGVVSDIEKIAAIAHRHGVPLIVDEAHGAHFPLDEQFPTSALRLGADIVIQSLHKTLPAFTQTALLHLAPGHLPAAAHIIDVTAHTKGVTVRPCVDSFVDEKAVRQFLGIYQSSSPSYLLMASMEQCMNVIEQDGKRLFSALDAQLTLFYEKCRGLKYIRLFEKAGEKNCFDWDCSKVLISASALGLSGQELYQILLEKYHLQMEMVSGHYVLALCSLMDRPEGFERLWRALYEIEHTYTAADSGASNQCSNYENQTHTRIPRQPQAHHITIAQSLYKIPGRAMTITAALESPGRTVLLSEAAHAVSREYLYLYPPGIPLLTPGERLEPELLNAVLKLRDSGYPLEGLSDITNQRINIVKS